MNGGLRLRLTRPTRPPQLHAMNDCHSGAARSVEPGIHATRSADGFRVRCFQLTAFAVGAGRPGMTSKAKWSAFDARSQPIACAAPPPVLRTTSPALAGEEYSECAARSFFPRQGGGSGREAVEGGERRINTPMKRCSPWLNSRTSCGNSGIVIRQR